MSAPTQPSRMLWTTRQRTLITAAVLLPVIFVLLQAGHAQREHGLMVESPCWILPNGWVVRPPGSSDCPLDTLDRVQAVVAADGTRTAMQEPDATKHAAHYTIPSKRTPAYARAVPPGDFPGTNGTGDRSRYVA